MAAKVEAEIEFEDRIEELEQAITKDPTNAELHKELGNIFHRSEAYELALAEYRTAVKLDAVYYPALYNMGNTYFEMGSREQAIICWQNALLAKPDLEEAIYNIGFAYYHMGCDERDKDQRRRFFEDAIGTFHRALELDPERGDTHLHLGLCWYELERFDQSVKCYRTALEHDSKDPDIHYNLGNVCYEKGVQDPSYFQEALDHYKKASKLDPEDLKSQNNIADCYLRLDELKKARRQIKKVLDENPDYLPAHCTLGEIYSREGNPEAAVGEFEMVLALDSKEGSILHKYASQHLIEELTELAAKRPNDPELRLRLGRAYKALGQAYNDVAYFQKSISEFQRAGGSGASVFPELAEVYIRLRQFDLALGALDAALERDPECITSLSLKAEVFARLGDRDRTIDLLKSIRKQAFS